MVAKNIWFIVRVFHNQLKTFKKQTKFNNLGGLDDNQSLKEIQWIVDMRNSRTRRSQSRRTKVTASPRDDENKEDNPQIINQWKYIVQKNLKIKRNISVPIYDIYRQVLVPIYPTYIYMLYIYLIHIFIVRCHVQKILTQITQPSHYIILYI